MFFWNSLAFSMIQQMLAIWSLVPLPFLKAAWTSGSSQFTYCWSLAWKILSDRVLMNYGRMFMTLYRRQEIKTIPKKKKCKKAKWLSEEALKIAVKRREAKSKWEKERYTHLNAEFQRIARRDKAFLSDQCKEIEENNRMGKTGEGNGTPLQYSCLENPMGGGAW